MKGDYQDHWDFKEEKKLYLMDIWKLQDLTTVATALVIILCYIPDNYSLNYTSDRAIFD